MEQREEAGLLSAEFFEEDMSVTQRELRRAAKQNGGTVTSGESKEESLIHKLTGVRQTVGKSQPEQLHFHLFAWDSAAGDKADAPSGKTRSSRWRFMCEEDGDVWNKIDKAHFRTIMPQP